MNRYRFETEGEAAAFLAGRGYVSDEPGMWRRGSWHAWVRRQKNGRYLVEIL